MKVLRCASWLLLTAACIVAGLVWLEVISLRQIQSLPLWLRVVVFACLVLSCVETIYGLVDDYRQIRRDRIMGKA